MLELVLAGLGTGSIYALIAVGFNVIFKSTDALNFAQGDWVMMGGMIAAYAVHAGVNPVWVACALACLAVSVAGGLSERIVIRTVLVRSPLSIMLVTAGISLVTKSLVMLTLGKDPQGYPGISGSGMIAVLGVNVPVQTFWIFGITAVLMVLTHAFFEKSRFGTAMRAASADRDAAALVGININSVVAASFLLAALFGGIAGVMITPLTLISYDAGGILGFKGFSAAMLGGLGNVYGAVAGGLILGLTESLVAGYVTTQFKDAVSFVVLLVVLMIRPQGLFGHKQITKV